MLCRLGSCNQNDHDHVPAVTVSLSEAGEPTIASVWISPSSCREPRCLNMDVRKNVPFLGAGTQPVQFSLVSPLIFVTLGVLTFAVTSWLMDRKLNL